MVERSGQCGAGSGPVPNRIAHRSRRRNPDALGEATCARRLSHISRSAQATGISRASPRPTSQHQLAPEAHRILAGRRKPPEFPVPHCAPRQGRRSRCVRPWRRRTRPGSAELRARGSEAGAEFFRDTQRSGAAPAGADRGGAVNRWLAPPANIRRASGAVQRRAGQRPETS